MHDIDAEAKPRCLCHNCMPRVYPSTTLLCSLSGLYYHSHIQTHDNGMYTSLQINYTASILVAQEKSYPQSLSLQIPSSQHHLKVTSAVQIIWQKL